MAQDDQEESGLLAKKSDRTICILKYIRLDAVACKGNQGEK